MSVIFKVQSKYPDIQKHTQKRHFSFVFTNASSKWDKRIGYEWRNTLGIAEHYQ